MGKRFRGTPILRAKRMGLIRNACVVAANQKFTDAVPQLKNLSEMDPDPVAGAIKSMVSLDGLSSAHAPR